MSTVNLVSCLVNHGKSLAKQLDIAKTMFEQQSKAKIIPKPSENNIYDEVEKVINGLINDLNKLDDDEDDDDDKYTTKECFDKVVRKTMSSLEELKKHDDPQYTSGYEVLVTRVGKFHLSTNVSPTVTASTPTHNNNNENDIVEDNINDHVQNTHINVKDSYHRFNCPQRSLLDIFALLPRGTNINKNDLCLWWLVSHGIKPHLEPFYFDGEEFDFQKDLKELVEMKMIEPVAVGVETVRINNKREGVKYKMPNIIWSKFRYSDENNKFAYNRIQNSLTILGEGKVINTNACNLTTNRINMLASHTFWMMQLGNWNHDPTKYIVVEDVDSLSKVLNVSPLLEFLSLEGVSGLVLLPFFKGSTLAVLNLKGCHNLESLPQFNTMHMRFFRYLNMSECYQLDHPANVLDGCTELRVVKGFVLPHQLPQPHDPFISNPSQFQHLWKLTLRTRRLSFPTNSDLETLCDLQSLTNLKITWVGACAPDNNQEVQFDVASKFPPKLTKFEMEAASDSTSTKILDLIAQQRNTNVSIPLKKLYIKGGNLSKLNPEVDCKILRLHYLPKIECDCYDMMKSFPELHRLETSE